MGKELEDRYPACGELVEAANDVLLPLPGLRERLARRGALRPPRSSTTWRRLLAPSHGGECWGANFSQSHTAGRTSTPT